MLVKADNAPALQPTREGIWRLGGWASRRIVAGVIGRDVDASRLLGTLGASVSAVEAEQVHGASLAMIGRAGAMPPRPAPTAEAPQAVPGCDALLTEVPGVALLVRTADCLPVFFADPGRGVVGMAHVGWRGLMGSLPARMVAAFRHGYQTEVRRLAVAIGPAIRACCYEVGPEFAARFGPFVQERGARRTCDLIGATLAELRRCGVATAQVWDTGQCTACGLERWYSLRREGPATGRLVSFILWQS